MTIKDEDNDGYSTSHNQRGVCLILENDEFHPSLEISNRGGSGVDSRLMVQCFQGLGFEVRINSQNTDNNLGMHRYAMNRTSPRQRSEDLLKTYPWRIILTETC